MIKDSLGISNVEKCAVKEASDTLRIGFAISSDPNFIRICNAKKLLTPDLQTPVVKKSRPNQHLTSPLVASNLCDKFNKNLCIDKSNETNTSIPKSDKIKNQLQDNKNSLFSGYYFFLTGFKGKKNNSNTPIKVDSKNTPLKTVLTPITPARSSKRNTTTPLTNMKAKSSPNLTISTKKRLTRSITDKISELEEPISEPDLIAIIESLGGTVVAHLADIFDSMNVVVIAERPLTTIKYLYSLARGLPAINKTWIKSCVENKSIISAANFKIESGSCYQRGKTHIFKDRTLAMRQGLVALPFEQRVLYNIRIGVYAFEISQLNDAMRLVKETGATTFEITDKFECSELFDYLVIFCNDEPTASMKAKIMKVWQNYRPKCIVTKYWLYDCLILQRKVEDFEFEGYRFNVF